MTTAENIDCMAGMGRYPDKWFDLAVCDFPYGINVNHNMGRRKGDKPSKYKPAAWDTQSPPKEVFDEVFRVSKNQIFRGANHMISKMPYDSPCRIMWDKQFSEEVSFAQIELAWTSFASTSKKFELHPSQQGRIHPTQKPVALYRWLLQNYAKPGQKILDPMMGSGSSRIAAHDMGFECVGFELDFDYFTAQEARFAAHITKPTIFAPEQMYNFEQKQLFE
jgi:site-specific DNA-methyltransferase (adenine-specific)